MINDFNASENKDIVKKDKNRNIQYQLTTSKNQKNSSYNNMTTIDLGTCEEKLKLKNGIDPSLPLIIFKIDYYPPDSLIPIIGYEIYHPITKEKLNLSLCEDVFMKLNIPINIDENNLFKYDPNSEFYTDNCFSYTTENGTDIIMKDRKQEFSDNKLSICENDCTFVEYNQQDKQSSCDCKIKNKENTISEIIESSNQLGNNFNNEESDSSSASTASNIISITCTKALFSKDGLKNNISSYILIIFITHYLVSILFFIKCGYPLLVNDIQKIINERQKVKKQNQKSNQIASQIGRKSKKIQKNFEKKISKRKSHYPPKKSKFNFFNNINPLKSKKLIEIKTTKRLSTSNNNSRNMLSNKNININNIINPRKMSLAKIINRNIKISFNDYELNSLNYTNAILYDKRTCVEYYLSLIKSKNAIIFSFCPRKDYNSMIIRSCIFSLSFSIYYAINFAFFTDDIMHSIYERQGKYDFLYFIPKIVFSFFVAYHITILIKIIFLSERNITQIRQQSTLNFTFAFSDKAKKNLII